jgi:hypothetical protein
MPPAERTPVALGSPAPGATTVHVEIGSGPNAGTYDVWTLEPACARFDDGTWLVTYMATNTAPTTVMLIAATDELDGSLVGSVVVAFPSDAGSGLYVDSEPVIDVDDQGSSATLSIVSDSAERQVWTADEPAETFELAVTIDCASVGD